MHKNTIRKNGAHIYLDNTGAMHAHIYATGREYRTYANAHGALYIKIKGARYYFIKAGGALLLEHDVGWGDFYKKPLDNNYKI